MIRFSAAAICLLLAAGCGDPAAELKLKHGTTEATFISGARFIAGDGSAPIEEATIILDGDEIFQVGKKGDLKAPKGSLQRTGLEGHTIIPMMVNLNGYPGLSSAGNFDAKNFTREGLEGDLNRYAYYGVAAVAAGGDENGLAIQVRDEQKQGKATGARLFTSSRGIAAKGNTGILGDGPLTVSSESDARAAVGKLADSKADYVLLWANGMKSDVAAAVIDEAHKKKLKVFADAPGLAEAKAVVSAGVDALIGSVREGDVDDALVSAMKEKKVSYAPALSALEARFIYIDSPRWRGESAMLEAYPPAVSAYLGDTVFLNGLRRKPETESFRSQFAIAKKNLKKVADGGVAIAFASGSGMPYTLPGYFEHHELELMVAAGLSTQDALKAASVGSSAALGAADLGALVPGKKANFLIIADDPIKEISVTKSVDEAWINGKQIDRLDLKRKYEVKPVKITAAQRADDVAATRKELQDAIDAKKPHYGNGKFILGPSLTVAPGLIVPTPGYSKASASSGPPYKVTVAVQGAAADLTAFYKETLRGWTAAGNCFDKAVPGQESKKFHACADASANQIILNINIQ